MTRCLPTFALLLLVAMAAAPAGADDLTMPADPAQGTPVLPERGMDMAEVQARYGEPLKKLPAVGDPPITRWEYPHYIVYFERDLVLHAVRTDEQGPQTGTRPAPGTGSGQ